MICLTYAQQQDRISWAEHVAQAVTAARSQEPTDASSKKLSVVWLLMATRLSCCLRAAAEVFNVGQSGLTCVHTHSIGSAFLSVQLLCGLRITAVEYRSTGVT